jgi:hypothetical protein
MGAGWLVGDRNVSRMEENPRLCKWEKIDFMSTFRGQDEDNARQSVERLDWHHSGGCEIKTKLAQLVG